MPDRVLIVDDSAFTRQLLADSIGRAPQLSVAGEAADGRAAIEAVRRPRPDVIAMDVWMPDMNGFQATRQITRAAQTSHIPVVIVSSKNQVADRVWGERQGAREYLVKPLDHKVLLQTVNTLLEHPAP